MDPPPLFAVAGLFAAAFLASLFTQSLREFSRSRLDELCRARGAPERFGEVLTRRTGVLALLRAATLALVVAAIMAAAAWGGLVVAGPVAGGGRWVGWAVLAVGGLFLLSVLPWAVARVTAEPLLARTWPLLGVVGTLFKPAVVGVRLLDRTLHRLAGRPDPAEGDAAVLNEELLSVVEEGRREGILENEAGQMIAKLIAWQTEDVAAVMTPRTEMTYVRDAATVEEARREFDRVGHSRLPVVGDTVDEVRGILFAKDLLPHLGPGGNPHVTVGSLARDTFFVPEKTGLDVLLRRMRGEKMHLALVVDEYGGVAGLVTLEDLLEEIVGEIVDEHDDPEEESNTGIERRDHGVLLVEGWVPTDDLNEETGLELPEDGDFETVAGFVMHETARVPEPGEWFEWQNLKVTVLDADGRRVGRVRIETVGELVES